MFCALLSLIFFFLNVTHLRQMTTKAMANTVASKPMISDEIPAVNSALLVDDSFVFIGAKNKDKSSFPHS